MSYKETMIEYCIRMLIEGDEELNLYTIEGEKK